MKIVDYKPMNKRDRVFEILDKQGYILDGQSVKILGENGLHNVSEYTRMWKRLKNDREYFKDKKIVEKQKGGRCHLVRIEGDEVNKYYKVGKLFYKEIDV